MLDAVARRLGLQGGSGSRAELVPARLQTAVPTYLYEQAAGEPNGPLRPLSGRGNIGDDIA